MELLENNEEFNKETDKIQKDIKSLKKELEQIQKNCPHKKYSIKYTDKKKVCRICDECGLNIGYASTDELKNNGFI